MENTLARKRVYEILGKLMRGEDLGLSSQNFTTNNEMVELVELLTNSSPFFDVESLPIRYSQILNGDANNRGQYIPEDKVIGYSIPYLEAIANNRINIMELFETVFHEQTHHIQDWYRNHSEVVDNLDYKRIIDQMDDVKSEEDQIKEIKELNEFANKHKLFGKRLTERQIKVLRFGAYLSNHCEVDARRNSYNSTVQAYEIMINDPLCPPELKTYLANNFEIYDKHHKKQEIEDANMMESYRTLEKKVEDTLFKLIKSGEKIEEKDKTLLLNGILDHITRSLPLSENLQIAKWALQHNYGELVSQINLRNSLSYEKRDLSHFITDILSNDLLTSSNFGDVCSLFYSFGKKTNDDAINYLVANLADRAQVQILLDHCAFGRRVMTTNDKYITPQMMKIALSNYLSRIETSKNIEDYEEYKKIEQTIRERLSARGLGINVKEADEIFTPFIQKFDRINENKEIKINNQNKEQTAQNVQGIEFQGYVYDAEFIAKLNHNNNNNYRVNETAQGYHKFMRSKMGEKTLADTLRDVRSCITRKKFDKVDVPIKMNIQEQIDYVVDFYYSISSELGEKVESMLSGNNPNYHLNFSSSGDSMVNHEGENEYLSFNVATGNSVESLINLAHEVSHALSQHNIEYVELQKDIHTAPKEERESIIGNFKEYTRSTNHPQKDCIVEIESHIAEKLFVDYLRQTNVVGDDYVEYYENVWNDNLAQNLDMIIDEDTIIEEIGNPATIDDIREFSSRYSQTEDYGHLMRSLRRMAERPENDRNVAKHRFRYVVGEMVASEWMEQYRNAGVQQQQEMLGQYTEYLSTTADMTAGQASRMLTQQTVTQTMGNFIAEKQNQASSTLGY